MIQNIAKVTLYVNNQEEAEKFWIEKMGFTLIIKQPMGEVGYWLEVAPQNGSTSFVLYELALMQKQNPEVHCGHPSLLLSTKNIMESFQIMSDKGVKVDPVIDMPYGRMFTFYDQDGNRYLLREDK